MEQITSSLGAHGKIIIDDVADVIRRGHFFFSPTVEEGENLLKDITNNSFSEETPSCCGDVIASAKPTHKYKRLHKADSGRCHRKEEIMSPWFSTN